MWSRILTKAWQSKCLHANAGLGTVLANGNELVEGIKAVESEIVYAAVDGVDFSIEIFAGGS